MKKVIIGIGGISISILAIYLISQNVSFEESWKEVQKVAIWQVALLMSMYMFSFIPRTYRWQLMLKNYPEITFSDFLKSILVGFAGNNFIPARGGELLRMEFFSRISKVSRITSLTSVLTEKILDGLALLFLLLLGIFLSPKNVLQIAWLKNLVILVSILFLGALVAMIVLKIQERRITDFLQGKENNRFFKILNQLNLKVQSALDFFTLGKATWLIISSSIFIWFIEATVFMLALYFLKIDIPLFSAGLMLLGIVGFGILIPSSPAYLGVFQGMSILALSLFNIPESLGLTTGILVHFCQFAPVSLIGGGILLSRLFK